MIEKICVDNSPLYINNACTNNVWHYPYKKLPFSLKYNLKYFYIRIWRQIKEIKGLYVLKKQTVIH